MALDAQAASAHAEIAPAAATAPVDSELTVSAPAESAPTEAPRAAEAVRPRSRFDRRTLLRGVLGFSIVSTLAMVLAPILGFLVPPKSA